MSSASKTSFPKPKGTSRACQAPPGEACQATPAPTLPFSNRDLSDYRDSPGRGSLAASRAPSRAGTLNVLGKGLWGTSAVSSKPSKGSVPKLLPSYLARCCPRDQGHLLVGGSAQALSPRCCSPGWACPSPSLNATGRPR